MSTPIKKSVVPVEIIQSKIYLIRGHKVMLDRDIAALYGVKPIALRQQVKRNADRFPDDFMFQLSGNEAEALLSQNVIPSKQALGGPCLMRLLNKAWPCSQVCLDQKGRHMSTSRSCGSSCG